MIDKGCDIVLRSNCGEQTFDVRLGSFQIIWNICLMGVVGATLHKLKNG